jgi:nicotinate (nicotinamide) nucleotide adenylyltransferase
MKRVGIFSGTFDPVHKGHIAFALQAIKEAKLDEIYFIPEAKPRRKEGMTHYAHRLAMLEIALKPYQTLKTLELQDKQFSVNKTMPRLKVRFKKTELYLLIGSDSAMHLSDVKQWPNADALLKEIGLIVGLRGEATESDVRAKLKPPAKELIIIGTDKKHASSRKIRHAAANNEHHEDSLRGTKKYMKKNWLYDSVTGSANKS